MDRLRFRLSSQAFDVILALALFVLAFSRQIEIPESGLEPFRRAPDVFNYALLGFMTLPLAFRRTRTVTVFVVVLLSWVIDRVLDYPDTTGAIGVILAFHSIGSELPRARSAIIGFPAVAGIALFTALGAATLESVSITSIIFTVIATEVPLHLGREVHERRRRFEELEARAELAERQREERAREAVADERARIARELHDVVAHQMTVVTLQADGARRIAQGADRRIVEALDTIRDAGRSALAEMRRMVGLLREPDSEGPSLAPMPQLSDLNDLLSTIRGAGLPVELEMTGAIRPLPEGTELSLYRIVQESLTNTARHGGAGVSAAVKIDYEEDRINVCVEDDGRGAAADSSDQGVGHGLVGMRERVSVLGGSLETGPRPGGGYRVRTTIPVAP